MPQSKEDEGLSDQYLTPQPGKTGYAAVERGLEVRGGPKKAKIGDVEKNFRKYHLKKEKVQAVLAKWHATGKFVSPYCKSITTDFLNALAALGLNEAHHSGQVATAMKKLMDLPTRVREKDGLTDWEHFKKKPKRTDKGKSMPGRIETLARNLRKTAGSGSPYPEGRKLEQIGCCVDLFIREWEEEQPHPDKDKAAAGEMVTVKMSENFYRLNTHSVKPKIVRIVDVKQIPPVNLSVRGLGPE